MEIKFTIEGVSYYQLAALVEDGIVTQDFFKPTGEPVSLSTRRTYTPTELAHRLEIGIDGDFFQPITLDCHAFTGHLLVTATCPQESDLPVFEDLLRKLCHYLGIPDLIPSLSPAPRSQPAPPREKDEGEEERTINLSTAQRVAEAKYRMLQGTGKIVAYGLANVSPKTYYRWKDDEMVDQLLQEMLEHPPEL